MLQLESLMEAMSNDSFHTSLEKIKDFFFFIMTQICVPKQPMPLIHKKVAVFQCNGIQCQSEWNSLLSGLCLL